MNDILNYNILNYGIYYISKGIILNLMVGIVTG